MKKEDSKSNSILVAEYIIYYGNKKDFWIDPLKLQKLLWYTQIEYYSEHKELLFLPERFWAWKYGPVLVSVWRHFFLKYKDLKPPKIEGDEYPWKFENLPKETRRAADYVLEKKGSQGSFLLTAEAHQQETWKSTTRWTEIKDDLLKKHALEIKKKFLDLDNNKQ